jgi:hypothetical protein
MFASILRDLRGSGRRGHRVRRMRGWRRLLLLRNGSWRCLSTCCDHAVLNWLKCSQCKDCPYDWKEKGLGEFSTIHGQIGNPVARAFEDSSKLRADLCSR